MFFCNWSDTKTNQINKWSNERTNRSKSRKKRLFFAKFDRQFANGIEKANKIGVKAIEAIYFMHFNSNCSTHGRRIEENSVTKILRKSTAWKKQMRFRFPFVFTAIYCGFDRIAFVKTNAATHPIQSSERITWIHTGLDEQRTQINLSCCYHCIDCFNIAICGVFFPLVRS